jgi:hypothetical protein
LRSDESLKFPQSSSRKQTIRHHSLIAILRPGAVCLTSSFSNETSHLQGRSCP